MNTNAFNYFNKMSTRELINKMHTYAGKIALDGVTGSLKSVVSGLVAVIKARWERDAFDGRWDRAWFRENALNRALALEAML
jgi:hypothetical protein